MPLPRFRIRTLMIAVVVVATLGGSAGMLVGLFAPQVTIGLYALDGPEPPAGFRPAAWGAQKGLVIGLTLGIGVWILACIVSQIVHWRPRIKTWHWMIAVAISAVVLEGWIVWGRYTYHRDQAAGLAKTAAGLRRLMAKASPERLAQGTCLDFEDGRSEVPATPEACQQFLSHLDRLARKNEYAARHPWLPVAPDPPEPK